MEERKTRRLQIGKNVAILHYGDREFEGSPEQKFISELLSEVYRRTELQKQQEAAGKETIPVL